MNTSDIERASLDNVKTMKAAGQLSHDPNAPAGGEALVADFWAEATLESPKAPPRSVHLKLDPEVFDCFKHQ